MNERFRSHTEKGEASPQRPNLVDHYIPFEHSELFDTQEAKAAIERVQSVIGSIDEQVLFDIYREYFGKSGNDLETFSGTISPLQNINIVYDKNSNKMGRYREEEGPYINAGAFIEDSDDSIVNTVIHEYLHELAHLPVQENQYEYDDGFLRFEDMRKGGVRTIESVYGYHPETGEVEDEAVSVTSRNIDEGITQLLADDIHAEYVKRVGVGGNTSERKNRQETGQSINAYGWQQLNVLIYITWLSSLTELPEDVVKKAVIRTYFRNGKIVPDEIKELLPLDIRPADVLASKITRELDWKNFDISALDAMKFYSELDEVQKKDFQQKMWNLKERYNQSFY